MARGVQKKREARRAVRKEGEGRWGERINGRVERMGSVQKGRDVRACPANAKETRRWWWHGRRVLGGTRTEPSANTTTEMKREVR